METVCLTQRAPKATTKMSWCHLPSSEILLSHSMSRSAAPPTHGVLGFVAPYGFMEGAHRQIWPHCGYWDIPKNWETNCILVLGRRKFIGKNNNQLTVGVLGCWVGRKGGWERSHAGVGWPLVSPLKMSVFFSKTRQMFNCSAEMLQNAFSVCRTESVCRTDFGIW